VAQRTPSVDPVPPVVKDLARVAIDALATECTSLAAVLTEIPPAQVSTCIHKAEIPIM
jgi:hypothetical protein